MKPDETSFEMASARMARALTNIESVLEDNKPVDIVRFGGALTRVVIATNTIATILNRTDALDTPAKEIANLLWSFGENLDIVADGARP
jgi:hypothetical protein